MTPAEGIRKLGFRRWYERQLIESHGFLVTGFLSMIAMVAAVEEFSLRAPVQSLFASLALIAGCGLVCGWSLKRYHALLARAERVGEHSVCEQCRVYGALEVVRSGGAPGAHDAEPMAWFRVRCRRCAHEWVIE